MFWSFDERSAELRELGGNLERLKQALDFEMFRPQLQRVREKERKDNSGRKPYDVVLMFKILVLQTLHNLSDEQTEYQIKDRISFMTFLDLTLEDSMPDQKTIWLFRDQLRQAGLDRMLFEQFEQHLRRCGLAARKGQILDAAILKVPRRNVPEQQAPEQIRPSSAPTRCNARHKATWMRVGRANMGSVISDTKIMCPWT